jgi:hypothetical protein
MRVPGRAGLDSTREKKVKKRVQERESKKIEMIKKKRDGR